MSVEEIDHFTRLKEAVQARAAERLGIRKPVKEWSLNDIRDFQADVESVCKSTVSEKWFYLHFKNDSQKLPRIDVLNLLSQYCGFKNWDEFSFVAKEEKAQMPVRTKTKKPIWLAVVAIFILLMLAVVWKSRHHTNTIIFKDAYTHEQIHMNQLTIKLKNQKLRYNAQKQSITYKTDTLFADGAYYKQKAVYIDGTAEDTLQIDLLPDDYALMLNFFSRTSSDDWQKRREQLMEAIHPEAKIFQNHPQYDGIELLNREEFIDRLILPLNSLKNLDIQHIAYKDEKIYRLRFIQKEDEK
jgi:hypothetical protein